MYIYLKVWDQPVQALGVRALNVVQEVSGGIFFFKYTIFPKFIKTN